MQLKYTQVHSAWKIDLNFKNLCDSFLKIIKKIGWNYFSSFEGFL